MATAQLAPQGGAVDAEGLSRVGEVVLVRLQHHLDVPLLDLVQGASASADVLGHRFPVHPGDRVACTLADSRGETEQQVPENVLQLTNITWPRVLQQFFYRNG